MPKYAYDISLTATQELFAKTFDNVSLMFLQNTVVLPFMGYAPILEVLLNNCVGGRFEYLEVIEMGDKILVYCYEGDEIVGEVQGYLYGELSHSGEVFSLVEIAFQDVEYKVVPFTIL